MTQTEIEKLVKKQRDFFNSGETLNVSFRISALEKLRACIIKYEKKINQAIRADLGKSAFESYMCETGLVLSELTYMIKHTRKFAKERTVHTPLAQFQSRSYQKPSPYGVVLIMSPWNYPLMLTLEPLIDALAAGNTAIVKPSAYSANTSELISRMLGECFDEKYVAVVTGGREENTCLLNEHFDYIFFTGSQSVGKEVMRCASAHLTPITLELGGKSPCIVHKSADIKLAAKRIVFGKFLNCGQTCVAPDYIYCDSTVKDELLNELKKQIQKQYGRQPLKRKQYGKIINEKHFDRLLGLIDYKKVVVGGMANRSTLQIEPTIMDNVTFSDLVMHEEIFGPILPVLTYDFIDEAVDTIRSMSHPLALYIFTQDKCAAKSVIEKIGFGGGCINDTLIHLATSEMPFGGFGESGLGSYHYHCGDHEAHLHPNGVCPYKNGAVSNENTSGQTQTQTQTQTQSAGNQNQVTEQMNTYQPVFDANYYYMNNPDLQSVVGSDSQKLFEHFYTCGMAEGRRASENFDVSVYKANNPDLVAVFGDDLKAYYTHYVQSGQLENRVCK